MKRVLLRFLAWLAEKARRQPYNDVIYGFMNNNYVDATDLEHVHRYDKDVIGFAGRCFALGRRVPSRQALAFVVYLWKRVNVLKRVGARYRVAGVSCEACCLP